MLQGTRLFMKTAGTFTVGTVDHDATQCGIRGTRELQYRVVIEGNADCLTPEGFIIDGTRIRQYFADTYGGHVETLPSCEHIAMRACEDFHAMLGDKGCLAVEVTVDGTGLWGLTASWRADSVDAPVAGAV